MCEPKEKKTVTQKASIRLRIKNHELQKNLWNPARLILCESTLNYLVSKGSYFNKLALSCPGFLIIAFIFYEARNVLPGNLKSDIKLSDLDGYHFSSF